MVVNLALILREHPCFWIIIPSLPQHRINLKRLAARIALGAARRFCLALLQLSLKVWEHFSVERLFLQQQARVTGPGLAWVLRLHMYWKPFYVQTGQPPT